MKVFVNSKERECEDGITVAKLISILDLSHKRVAVEVNKEIVRRVNHDEFILNDADKIEIVTFTGGG